MLPQLPQVQSPAPLPKVLGWERRSRSLLVVLLVLLEVLVLLVRLLLVGLVVICCCWANVSVRIEVKGLCIDLVD